MSSSSASNSNTLSPATPGPTTSPVTTEALQQQPPLTSNLAILILLTSPVIALLPPRKLDIYTFCLGSAFVLAAGHIYTSELPATSRLRRFINEQKYSSAQNNNNNNNNNHHRDLKNSTTAVVAQAVERVDEEGNQDRDRGGVKAMARKFWMGKETPGWEGRRMAREREVLDEGGGIGYGELIGESIMDVFGAKEEREEEGKGD